MSETDLILSVGGLPPQSARGCQQVLIPIQNGEMKRTVNGSLIYTGNTRHQKYATVITCQDKAAPALDGIWIGAEVLVNCIQRLWQKISDHTYTRLNRDPTLGSVVAMTALREDVPIASIEGREITLKTKQKEAYIGYQPQLLMRVKDFHIKMDEWEGGCSWRLEMEEI